MSKMFDTLNAGDRVYGPYPKGKLFRLIVRRAAGPGQKKKEEVLSFPTEALALKTMEKLISSTNEQLPLADAIEKYIVQEKTVNRREATRKNVRFGLRRFFDIRDTNANGGMPVQMVTTTLCRRLWEQKREAWAPDTAHATLHVVQGFAAWLVASRLVKENPVEELEEPRAKVKHGKTVLTIDESRRLIDYCLTLANEAMTSATQGRREKEKLQRVTATLCALLLGMRAGEIVGRLVRDLDNRGTVLRVVAYESLGITLKTPHSARPLHLPKILQPLLAELAKGKRPMDPLFDCVIPKSVKPTSSGRRRHPWVWQAVTELCEAAGVTVTGTHGLRHTHITLARMGMAEGSSSDLVMSRVGMGNEPPAAMMPVPSAARVDVRRVMEDAGHNNLGQTNNYTQPGVISNADISSVSSVLFQ